jgi:hypothetical protein
MVQCNRKLGEKKSRVDERNQTNEGCYSLKDSKSCLINKNNEEQGLEGTHSNIKYLE